MSVHVRSLGFDDLRWPLADHGTPAASTPSYNVGNATWARAVYVDPFPAYPHDLSRVEFAVEEANRWWPLDIPVTFNLLEHETLDRMNGATYLEHDYYSAEAKEQYETTGTYPRYATIIMCGKRLPPHPSMTWYLVGHEYGHAVAHELALEMFPDSEERTLAAENAFYDWYAGRRGLTGPKHASGGHWHEAVAEVVACDFRLAMGTEIAYWPHGDVPRPSDDMLLWWRERAVRQRLARA